MVAGDPLRVSRRRTMRHPARPCQFKILTSPITARRLLSRPAPLEVRGIQAEGTGMAVSIDGRTLKGRQVLKVARPGPSGRFEKASLAPAARERIAATRAHIDAHF